jgi:heme-degrading monooxygenase HmoA
VVANGLEEDVCAALLARPHLADDAAGFVRMEVLRATERPSEFWLLTYWTDRESCASWHRGHAYRESHRGMPAGLKLEAGSASVRFFRKLCE